MRCLLVYDIPDDRVRSKIADDCLDYGLERIQYSAFAGKLSRNRMEELMKKVTHRLGRRPGRILLLPVPEDVWAKRFVHERRVEGEP